MELEGVHHITAITADARRNVEFYARLLGLRMVKKTVNFDAPDVYHLYYADERGSPGSVLTFFEFPGTKRGRAGAGAVHEIAWRVAGRAALDFWQARLETAGVAVRRDDGALRFADPEGLRLALVVEKVPDPPLRADWPEVPAEHALLGFAGVRAYAAAPEASSTLLEQLGFKRRRGTQEYRLKGGERQASFAFDEAPERPNVQGAGSVHHVAWASRDRDHAAWRARAVEAGAVPTEVIDRLYFRSIYFREPSGVLFEIATLGPGFTVDEPLERLGIELRLPERYESRRAELERQLTPVENPRA